MSPAPPGLLLTVTLGMPGIACRNFCATRAWRSAAPPEPDDTTMSTLRVGLPMILNWERGLSTGSSGATIFAASFATVLTGFLLLTTRLKALTQVLEEKLVKRHVSLKALDRGKVEEAAKGTVRQTVSLNAGISADHARKINKFIKDRAPKGVSSQTQGDQLRVSGKKRDDLQAVIAALKGEDFGIPLQFTNFRD